MEAQIVAANDGDKIDDAGKSTALNYRRIKARGTSNQSSWNVESKLGGRDGRRRDDYVLNMQTGTDACEHSGCGEFVSLYIYWVWLWSAYVDRWWCVEL